MSKRRARRVPVAMPIVLRTRGGDPAAACTLDVTRAGARVQLGSRWNLGETIWVERRGRRAQFRVVWVGEDDSDHRGQIGIECVDRSFDWGVPLPYEPDRESEHVAAAAAVALAEYSPE